MAQDNFLQPINQDKESRSEKQDAQQKHTIIFRDQTGALKMIKNGVIVDVGLPANNPVKIEKKSPVRQVKPKVNKLAENIDRVISQSHIHFVNDLVENRFRKIVESRLRNIRDNIQTREILISPLENGGMEFDQKTADLMISLIKQEVEKAEGSLGLPGIAPSVNPDRTLVFKDHLKIEGSSNKLLEPVSTPEIKIKKDIKVPSKPTPTVLPLSSEVKKNHDNKNKLSSQSDITKIKSTLPVGKPIVQDVSFKPHLTGPLEELQDLTLVDFYRLGVGPSERTAKIKEKIDLLEKDSFGLKLQGIEAWKNSEVYQRYLAICRSSIEQKKPLDQIVELFSQSEPKLSLEDVEAIIELNNSLRRL